MSKSDTEKASSLYSMEKEASGTLVLRLQCRLDQENVILLVPEFTALLKASRPTHLVVNLAEVDYIDDFGVSLLAGDLSGLSLSHPSRPGKLRAQQDHRHWLDQCWVA